MRRLPLLAAALGLTLAGCVTNPETGQQQLSKAGGGALIGAGSGALLGAIIGGRHNRTETIIGAGIGAIAGAGIGSYMDQQEKELRARTANSGIEVQRQGNEINLKLPSGITFDFNSAAIKPEARPALDQVAQTLVAYPSTFVDVSGHTDSVGTDAVNQKLSEQRAQSVADYLAYQGVNRARIAARGYGKQFPVASNDTDAGRAQNRRVEIKLSPVTDQDYREAGRPATPPRPGTPIPNPAYPPPPPGYYPPPQPR